MKRPGSARPAPPKLKPPEGKPDSGVVRYVKYTIHSKCIEFMLCKMQEKNYEFFFFFFGGVGGGGGEIDLPFLYVQHPTFLLYFPCRVASGHLGNEPPLVIMDTPEDRQDLDDDDDQFIVEDSTQAKAPLDNAFTDNDDFMDERGPGGNWGNAFIEFWSVHEGLPF